MKPKTIEEIHEEARLKREKDDFDRERDKQQRRDQYRSGGGPQLYGESRGSRGSGSRGSGIRQQSNRTDEDRNDNRVIVDSLRQYQSNEKRNQGQVVTSTISMGMIFDVSFCLAIEFSSTTSMGQRIGSRKETGR